MSVTTRGDKPSAADSPLWGNSAANINKPTTPLIDAGYAVQTSPGSANWNWITNYLSAAATHLMIYGTASWDINENYVADSYTNRNGIIFKSRVAGNQGNIPESSPTQWHDTRTPLPIAISGAGTHVPQSEFNEVLNIDTSGGDFALTIDPALFSNQVVKIMESGGNTVDLTISGHTGTVPLTDQTLIILWNGSGYFIEQSTIASKVVAASGAVVLGPVSFSIELDVSLGNVDIDPLSLSDFIGQHVHFYAVGSGIASIGGGNGVYVNDVYITENTGGAHLRGVSGGLWKVDNGATAKYTSSSHDIEQRTDGSMEDIYFISVPTSLLITVPVAFSDVLYRIQTTPQTSAARLSVYGINSASQYTIYVFTDAGAGATINVSIMARGKY